LLPADFCDSDSFSENERQAKLEQSRTTDHHKLRFTVSTLSVAGAIVAPAADAT
jgi:hypothetical protein